MIALMAEDAEKKEGWNLRVYKSIADRFDELVTSEHRGQKGLCVSAAVLMFVLADESVRQSFVDWIKIAEGRGMDGNVLEAATQASRRGEIEPVRIKKRA